MSERPELAVFWGDTRKLMTKRERTAVLQGAILESLTPNEVLLRDPASKRLIVVTAVKDQELYCALCRDDLVRRNYGETCPGFAKCVVNGEHRAD